MNCVQPTTAIDFGGSGAAGLDLMAVHHAMRRAGSALTSLRQAGSDTRVREAAAHLEEAVYLLDITLANAGIVPPTASDVWLG